MISQVDITENFVADNVFLLKIKSNSLLYQKMPFCKTVVQTNNTKTTAYINILNNGATVFCYENFDVEEIEAFLKFSGITNVFCNETFAKKSQNYRFINSVLLKCKKTEKGLNVYEKTFYPEYKFVYNLVSQEFGLPEYNEFVSDLSFRINHNKSRIITCEDGVVFTGWEDKNSAIISAISVYITNRGKSVGTKLLKSMIFNLKQDKKKNIFVYCEEKVLPFYLKNGFELEGKIFIGR